MVRPEELITLDAGRAGLPLSLTKPLGVGVLNTRHKATGERFAEAVASMAALNRDAARAAVAAGVRCGTDVTGFGLLGHPSKLARASRLTVAIDAARVPYLPGAREARPRRVRQRRHPAQPGLGGAPWTDFGGVDEAERLLLADAQTSGGLLVAGELPGAPVIGELLPRARHLLVVRLIRLRPRAFPGRAP